MERLKIAVIGSVNIDFVVESSRIPQEGETLQGDRFFTTCGGKGANQAIAASKLGGDVTFFGAVGQDTYGEMLIENFQTYGVQLEQIQTVPYETGIAFVQLTGEHNRITVVRGANDALVVPTEEQLALFDIIVMQFEIPFSIIESVIKKASTLGKTIIVDPAPARRIDPTLLEKITYLLPNEVEYKELLQTSETIEEITNRYPEQLIVTRGNKGVSYTDRAGTFRTIRAEQVDVQDTTGAGDTFAGAFAVALAEGQSLDEALQFASGAAALATTKKGAQTGMPTRIELKRWKEEKK